MGSVLQQWVMDLPLREQGTLLTAVRGCDVTKKERGSDGHVVITPERQLVSWLRWTFLNPADPREIDAEPGAWFSAMPPKLRGSELGHLPLHFVSHVMHALEVVAYRHPNPHVADRAGRLYDEIVHSLHLKPEGFSNFVDRLSEDRIAKGEIVS